MTLMSILRASSFSDCGISPDVLVDHYLTCTYLSGDRTTTVIDARGINYTPSKNTFADRFEDLVYAATDSLDTANGGWTTLLREDFNGNTLSDTWGFDQSAVRTVSNGLLTITPGPYESMDIRTTYQRSFTAPNQVRIRMRRRDYQGDPLCVSGSSWFCWTSTASNWGNITHQVYGRADSSGANGSMYYALSPNGMGTSSENTQWLSRSMDNLNNKWVNMEFTFDKMTGKGRYTFWVQGEAASESHEVILNLSALAICAPFDPMNPMPQGPCWKGWSDKFTMSLVMTGLNQNRHMDIDFIEVMSK